MQTLPRLVKMSWMFICLNQICTIDWQGLELYKVWPWISLVFLHLNVTVSCRQCSNLWSFTETGSNTKLGRNVIVRFNWKSMLLQINVEKAAMVESVFGYIWPSIAHWSCSLFFCIYPHRSLSACWELLSPLYSWKIGARRVTCFAQRHWK